MKRYTWSQLDPSQRRAALARPARGRDARVAEIVRRIFGEIEGEGLEALNRWAERIDRRPFSTLSLTPSVVDRYRSRLEAADLEALDLAVENVRLYHARTRPRQMTVETRPGVVCRRVWRPIRTAGLYVPGGSAPLFSTLVMLAVPAQAAGVGERVAVTPPGDGEPHPMMAAAAAACGLEALNLVGGAQAIAALAFGVATPRADKIFGPGNAFVAEAKRYAAEMPGGPAVDMPAGPSELLVAADASADPALVAADLLSQAEHDADAQVILVGIGDAVMARVADEIERQLRGLPREAMARASLQNGRLIAVRDSQEAVEVINAYAPEHLSLQMVDAEARVEEVECAGAVFLGRNAAETFGDYLVGPSHVLPTDGAARTFSGVSVTSFMSSFVIQSVDDGALEALAGPAARLARLEGLEAHARAAEKRMRKTASQGAA